MGRPVVRVRAVSVTVPSRRWRGGAGGRLSSACPVSQGQHALQQGPARAAGPVETGTDRASLGPTRPPYRGGHGQPQRDPRVPRHPSRPDHPRAGRPAGLRRQPARRRGCAARRSPMLAGVSVDYYIRLERGDLSGASDSVLDALAARPAARRGRAGPPVRPGPRSRQPRPAAAAPRRPHDRVTARPSSASSTPITDRAGLGAQRPADIMATNHARPRALLARCSTAGDDTAQHAPASSSSTRGAVGLLRRLRPHRQRLRGHAACRGRPQPVRQGPDRPHRRALHPQRGLPHPVGRARRALPPHRPQAAAPPRRRRPRPRPTRRSSSPRAPA